MKEALLTITKLREMSGNAQIDYLVDNKSDLLKQIFEYTYDPHRKYKIDDGKYKKILSTITTSMEKQELNIDQWLNFVKKLDRLEKLKSAKDIDTKDIINFIQRFKEEDQKFLEQVLFKDLRLNMGIKKFQKVWPQFCEQPQVQLANMWEGQIFQQGYYSRKLDGLRTYILNGVAYSRSNKEHKKAPFQHIVEQITNLPDYKDYVFDGELIYLNPNGSEDFTKAISLARSDERYFDCDNLYYIIFDIIKREDFINKTNSTLFKDEYNFMLKYLNIKEEKLSWFKTNLPNILVIKQVTEDKVSELRKACKELGWEGLMYRDGNMPYEYKRTKSLLKMKEMKDTELKLIGMEEGTGRHEGRLGAFIVEYENSTVKIGSGFSDEQRNEYWNNKDKYIGQYVKTQYFEKTTNQEGIPSLRFPVFLCFRNINTNEEFLVL